jgi:L-2,4-diaminobutyrate decarboxylase
MSGESSSVPPSIAAAFDPERFRAEGHQIIDAIADVLARHHRGEGPAIPYRAPEAGLAAWANVPHSSLVDDMRRVMDASTALAHPRCMGHQVPPPLPGAALAELVSAVMNNGMAVYEMGLPSSPIELHVVRWLAGKIGYTERAGGVLTSGGSLGNLTALLAMRQAHSGFNVWKQGAHAGPPLAVIVGADAHYSIARTLRVMGWGDAGVIVAPLDARHRMGAAAVRGVLEVAWSASSLPPARQPRVRSIRSTSSRRSPTTTTSGCMSTQRTAERSLCRRGSVTGSPASRPPTRSCGTRTS